MVSGEHSGGFHTSTVLEADKVLRFLETMVVIVVYYGFGFNTNTQHKSAHRRYRSGRAESGPPGPLRVGHVL